MHGYHGKMLRLDLGSASSQVEEPGEKFYRLYPGPGLYGTYYLLKETPPGTDPFAAESLLIIGCGVAGGNLGTGLARFGVVAKSPLTGGIFESRGEGPFARGLKGSGYDALILRGKAGSPSYLLIDGGKCSVLPAIDLWGLNTADATAVLEARYGSEAQIAVIGPAGERLVRFAGIVSAGAHQTQRGGLGAVMGSKNLKAVVIVNPVYPQVANAAAIAELDRLFREEGITNNSLNSWQKLPPGSSYWLDNVVDPGYVSSRNGQRHDYTPPPSFAKDKYAAYMRLESACPGCANDCIKTFNTRRLTHDDRAGGTYWETLSSFAINLDLRNLEAYFDMNTACMLNGLDPVSTGNVLGFAAECAEKGVLDSSELGYEFGFGELADRSGCRLIEDIALRRGAGDALAEGVRLAAVKLGRGAEAFALHVKGMECIAIEGRSQTNLALGYATAAVGPQGDICEHDWDYDVTVGWSHTLDRSATMGIYERIPMGLQSPEKARNYRALNLVWSGTDALGVCLYACAPTRYLKLEQIAGLVGAVTGWDFSSYELFRAGERRNALMRCYNYREGFSSSDDTLPERFYTEPIRTGRHAGAVIDRAKFREMVQTYYEMCGWDSEGRPTMGKLYDLHLEWVAATVKFP
jgi:aldehyde:ferredoxin oxidoreductase